MWYDTHDRLDQRALTSAIWTYDAKKVVSIDVEIDMLERDVIIIPYPKVAYRN